MAVHVEALVTELPVEALDLRMLHPLPWSDEAPLDATFVCPLIEGVATELGGVVRGM